MKTLKETIKDMEELGLVIERVIVKPETKSDIKYEIQFKKEVKKQ